MTEKEKKRLLARAEKLKPKPQLLPSGSWRCLVTISGQRISVTADTPEEAHAQAVAMKSGYLAKEKKGMTVKQAVQTYIADRTNVLSPSTLRAYKNIADNYFEDLSSVQVSQITEADLQKQINKYAETKSPKTVKNAVSFLVAVVSIDHPVNIKRLKYPTKKQTEHAYLEGPEIAQLIDACRNDPVELPVLFALWLGLRRSELCALHWEDIDFTRKTVSVTKALVPDSDNKFVLKNTTKTEKSTRLLSCPDYILTRLDALYPDKSKRSGRIINLYPNDIYNKLKLLCEKHKIPFVGVHGLRHTNASVMLSLGITDKLAMARGGWSSKDTMQSIYQHLFADDKSAADTAINNYFSSLAVTTAHETHTGKQKV